MYPSILKQYFQENRQWFRRVFFIFLIGFGIGVAGFFLWPDLFEKILGAFRGRFGENPALDMNLVEEIFFQNSVVSVIAIFGGLIFGLPSLAILLVNGFILGYIITAVFIVSGSGFYNALIFLGLGLIPHGIIEIPAFFIASALGLQLGVNWIFMGKGNRKITFKNDLRQAVLYLPVVLGLLIIAAFIEVYVSGNLVNRIGL